jgi:hypothetical protein
MRDWISTKDDIPIKGVPVAVISKTRQKHCRLCLAVLRDDGWWKVKIRDGLVFTYKPLREKVLYWSEVDFEEAPWEVMV